MERDGRPHRHGVSGWRGRLSTPCRRQPQPESQGLQEHVVERAVGTGAGYAAHNPNQLEPMRTPARSVTMDAQVKIIYWQDGDFWLGYIEEYPDYMTQGMSLEELRGNLKDVYKELSSGAIPCARREEELVLT
jgi:hypothetical protein